MSLLVTGLAYGTVVVQLSLLLGLGIYLARMTGADFGSTTLGSVEGFLHQHYRELAFLQALVAMSGSLYMSNVLGWTPCRLCWFQRIAVYPMVVLLGTALALDRDDVADYVLPLAILGIPVSIYHYIVQRISQFHAAGCSVLSVSCSTEYTFYFGYINVPMMALTAMLAILVLMWKFSSTES
ncbi:MAG: disulfide bond formation protein B [Candidatus Nanohaloarchaea archaeon]